MRYLNVLNLTFALASSAGLLSACGDPPHGGPPPELKTPQVGVLTLQSQRMQITNELAGRTAPVLVAEVRPQITGLVKSRNFVEGSEVAAGTLLYEVESSSYRASLDSASAALEKARATLDSARLKADRYRELVSIKAVSQQEADDAIATLRQGEADVASAKAAVASARINLDYTRITAPISGRIGKSSVTPGALVTANQTAALATVQKLDPIYVDVTQTSAAVLRLKRALAQGTLTASSSATTSKAVAKVGLLLEDGTRYPMPGTLQFSDVSVDQNTGAISLRASFPNPNGELLPGMYVRAVLDEGVNEQALLAPQAAVSRDASGKPIAFVVSADNKLEQRQLETERAVGDQWLISTGLKAGDRLVVNGAQKARPGQTVEALPYLAGPTAPAAVVAAADAAGLTVRTASTALPKR